MISSDQVKLLILFFDVCTRLRKTFARFSIAQIGILCNIFVRLESNSKHFAVACLMEQDGDTTKDWSTILLSVLAPSCEGAVQAAKCWAVRMAKLWADILTTGTKEG